MTNVVEGLKEELCIEGAVVLRLGVCSLRGCMLQRGRANGSKGNEVDCFAELVLDSYIFDYTAYLCSTIWIIVFSRRQTQWHSLNSDADKAVVFESLFSRSRRGRDALVEVLCCTSMFESEERTRCNGMKEYL
jgi:hypothetical protein